MLSSLISPIANLAGTWLQGRVDKSKAESDVKVARAKAEAKVYETEATSSMLMEQSLTNQMAGSWKDEFALTVLLLPAILVFIPSMTEYVRVGFEVLNTLPEWYQYLLFIAISASFGIKGAGQAMKIMGKK